MGTRGAGEAERIEIIPAGLDVPEPAARDVEIEANRATRLTPSQIVKLQSS